MKISQGSLIEMLKNGPMSIVFTKVDGTQRLMNCTKNMSLVPGDKHPKGDGKPTPANIIKVFDVDINEWRSFKYDSIISINGVTVNETE